MDTAKVDPEKPDKDIMARAGEVLRRGGLIAFPTETVYGLGADALNPDAVARVYKVKGRPSDNPLILHGNSLAELEKAAIFPRDPDSAVYKLAESFWPGPFTMVLPGQGFQEDKKTVAVRIPSHPVSRALIAASGCIIAAPSANKSGRPSPTQAWHVAEDFEEGGIDMLIDGGPTHAGLESTVVDLHTGTPRLLRPGTITAEMLQNTLGEIPLITNPDMAQGGRTEDAPLSPGMKYRHYAPKTPLILLVGHPETVRAVAKSYGDKAGFLPAHGEDPNKIARDLFHNLRWFDRMGVSVIVAEGVKEEGIGLAIMNRLKKAAVEVIYL